MRRALAFILALTIAASAMTDLGHYGHYLANKAYIAANLCVNKLRPAKHCEGKCYLMNQIRKDKENESEGIPAQRELTSQLQYVDLTSSVLPHFFSVDRHRSMFRFDLDYHFDFTDLIFHPPRVLA